MPTRPSSAVVASALGLALLLAGPVSVAPAADVPATSSVPAHVAPKLDAFRKVAWADLLKPSRPDPAPEAWKIRCAAEWTLAALERKDAAALLPLLGDADRFVRALAARSIGIAQPDGATAALVAALAAEKDRIVRIRLVEALARVGGDGALAAVEAQQVAGADADLSFHVGLARRQLKGGAWDVASIRGEHADAARTAIAAAKFGEPAPEIALPSPNGPVNLSTLKGRPVVLVFAHGDRGGPDAKALARLSAAQAKLDACKAAVVVVDPHEKERTKAWAERQKLPFTFASDPAGRAAAAYGVARQLFVGGEWLPSPGCFVIDPQGRLAWGDVGTRPDDQFPMNDLLDVLDKASRGVKTW